MGKIVNLYDLKLNLFSKTINESNGKTKLDKYIELISKSPVLLYENYIYDNLLDLSKGYDITDSFLMENLNFLDKFTKEEIYEANVELFKSKLTSLNEDIKQPSKTLTALIEMYVNGITPANLIDFNNKKVVFLKEINEEKCKKDLETESDVLVEFEGLEEDIIENSLVNEYVIKFFNDKYKDKLDENQINLINILFKEGDDSDKKVVFNEYKNNVLSKINEMSDVDDEIKKQVVERINEITYNPTTLIDNFIVLNELIS